MVCTNNDLTEIIESESSSEEQKVKLKTPSKHEICLMKLDDYGTSAKPIDFIKYLGYSILEVFLRRSNESYLPSIR